MGEALRRGNVSAGMGDRKTAAGCGFDSLIIQGRLKAGKIPELGSQEFFWDCFHRQEALTHTICTAWAKAVTAGARRRPTSGFTPTADNFFSKVSKTRILEAMAEAGKANSSAASLKKGPLAELAETTLAGTGWLPEPIRIAPEQPEDKSFALFEDEEEVTEEQP